MCLNQAARAIIDKHQGIELNHGRLQLQDRAGQRALDRAIDQAMAARTRQDGPRRGELMRLHAHGGMLLGMLVTPAPLLEFYQGRYAPSVILHLAELSEGPAAARVLNASPADLIAQLLDLTRQEARLAGLLASGRTISEAAGQMGIAVSAARNYSKNIYAKLGIKGQTDLVRILCKSSALLR
ncbi:Bacterial regulatory protein, luxR family [compost metagenome]